jgi:hypothetical protein
MDAIREQIETMRTLAQFGAYGLEGLGSLIFPKSKGLGSHLGRCVRSGTFDAGFESVARREPGGWWAVATMVIIAVFVHFAGGSRE